MTMKKILAGVLSAATVLSLSATAFAAPAAPDTTKAVTKPGETEYEAGVGMMSAELDVELPSAMKAFINPYGAVVAVEEGASAATSNAGVVSWAYEVVNNTTDFGIMIDVKAGKVTPAATVAIAAPGTAETATAKTAALVLQAGATAAEATKYDKAKTASAQAAANGTQGIFVFSTTADNKSKIAYAPAKTTAPGKVYLGLTGAISKVDGAGEDLEWTEDDTITATYTLKINPSAKTQDAAFNGAGGGPTFTDPTGVTGAVTAGTGVANLTRTGDAAYSADLSKAALSTATNVTTAFNIPLDTGVTVTSVSSSNTTAVNAAGTQIQVQALSANVGDIGNLTITLSNSTTIIIAFTIAA